MSRSLLNLTDKDQRLKRGVLVFCCLTTVASIVVAFLAWRATPDISSYSLFAEPQTHKIQTKAAYLLGPIVVQLLGLMTFIGSLDLVESKPRDLLISVMWGLGTFAAELACASRALQAFGSSLGAILPF